MISWLRRRKPLGQQGEDAAASYLRKAGFHIIERNVKIGRYELDIVAEEGDMIAFVEVKTRRSDAISPEVNVDATKRRHICRAARSYAEKRFDGQRYYRFDVVTVVLPERGKPDVTLIRDAFPDQR